MKRLRMLIFVCLLLCFVLAGCSLNMKGAKSVLPNLEEADRIVISVQPQANPEWASPAKDCTEPQDVQAVVNALLSFKIGDSTDTIYGGETIRVLAYKGETLLYDLSFQEKTLSMDGDTFLCEEKPDFEKLYASLSAAEEEIMLTEKPSA